MLFKSDLWDRRVSSAGKYRLAENSALEVLFNLILLLSDFCILGHCRSGKFDHHWWGLIFGLINASAER